MSTDNEACARDVLETVPVVMRFIRDQVRQRRATRLSLPQFRALTFVHRTRNSSLSAAAGHLGLSLPAMSRLVDGLVADGLVARQTVSTNRRQIALALTGRGRATLKKARNEIRIRLAAALKPLPAAEQKTVRHALRALQKIFGAPVANAAPSPKVQP